ncbi:MAG: filamentous hemagglutinin N-terminal domain-containing protein [Cyanobacteria bacterium P01_F01_bin.150]
MVSVENSFIYHPWIKIINTLGLFLLVNFSIQGQHQALAQVTHDGTLSTTVRSIDNFNFVIEQGDQAGINLFHSFDQFSIPTDSSVYFNNAIDIQNIISRITGSEISNIDGLIKANGNANLFLLNPNGFLFGPNARLDIGGSFLATTADRLLFDNQLEFSISDLQSSPLLSIKTPIGLQLGQSSGAVEIQGPGHQLNQISDLFPISNNASDSLGLEVSSGQSLAFIGNTIQLDGAVLTAPGGSIELGSVAQGRIEIVADTTQNSVPWHFNYEGTLFNDIQLSNLALVDVSASQAGSVGIEANRLSLNRGSAILSQTGHNPGGNIIVQAHDSILVNGLTTQAQFRTLLAAETLGEGAAGNIFITTPALRVRNGGRINTSTFNSGQGGDIEIWAKNKLQVAGVYPFLVSPIGTEVSTIRATAIGGRGNAGNIDLQTGNLIVKDGAVIASSTLIGQGNSGNISIQADSIRLTGNNNQLSGSGISSATLGSGNAGTVEINTRLLEILDGNIIDSSSISDGNAGSLDIHASERILVRGAIPNPFADDLTRSRISSEVTVVDDTSRQVLGLDDSLEGNAGDISITTPNLKISDQAAISLIVEGSGDSGELEIETNTTELVNQGTIAATTITGSGGDINLDTHNLILDNGLINASTTTSGNGGNINIQAIDINIMGTGSEDLRQNAILPAFTNTFSPDNFTQGIGTFALEEGQAGQIQITSEQLHLQNGGIIASSAFKDGTGGNIDVVATDIEVIGSVLTTSTFGRGTAGNIEIETNTLGFRDGGQFLSATFGEGNAGNLTVQASGQVLLDGRSPSDGLFASGLSAGAQRLLSSETEIEASGLGGDIMVTAPLLLIQNGAEVSASADTINFDGLFSNRRSRSQSRSPSVSTASSFPQEARAGNVTMDIGTLILDNGAITALSEQSGGGNITLDIDRGLILADRGGEGAISTQAGTGQGDGGNGGNITITSPFLAATGNSDIVANAFDGDGGNIQITTEGLFNLAVRDRLTDGNDITASSQSGISGTVQITTPDIDPSSAAVILPTTITDVTQAISTSCNVAQGSYFVIIGQGGLSTEPDGNSDRSWYHIFPDFGTIPETIESATVSSAPPTNHSAMKIHAHPQEATEFTVASDGSIQLTANRSLSLAPVSNCL